MCPFCLTVSGIIHPRFMCEKHSYIVIFFGKTRVKTWYYNFLHFLPSLLLFFNSYVAERYLCVSILILVISSISFLDKDLVGGPQIALGTSTTATVNMAPMSQKISWTSLTTPPRRPNDNLFLKVYQNPLLILYISAPLPPLADLVRQEVPTSRMRTYLSEEKVASQVCLAWRS